MYSAKARHIFMAFAIAAALIFAYYKQLELTAASAFLFFFILRSHFKHSSVLLASKYFKSGAYEKATEYLAEVSNPDRLARNRRGYYEFMLANIALKKGDYSAAEHHFQIASRFPMGGKNEKSFILIHLANIALRNKDDRRVVAYIERAKELAVSARATELINRIEKELNKLKKDSDYSVEALQVGDQYEHEE